MYITVRYGDSKEEIFNPSCRTHNLLSSIKKKCKCSNVGEIDLSDEHGNVKYLREIPNRYASEILAERETLILLKVDVSGEREVYEPLLMDDDFITEEFKSRLSQRSTSGRPGSKRGKLRKNKDTDLKLSRDRSREKRNSARQDKRSRSRQGK